IIAQELTPTYLRLAETRRVLEPVIDTLGLDISVGTLQRSVETEAILDTSLFEIIVHWSDPDTAAAIANEVANQLVISNPSNLSPALQNQIDLSQSQIDLLTTQIADLRNQLQNVDGRIAEAERDGNQEQLDNLLGQRSDIIGQINQATATIAQLSATITQIEQRSNAIIIQQEATPPSRPISGNTRLFTAVAALGSAMLVGGAAVLLEAADTTFRSERRIELVTELPVRGTVELGSRRQLAHTNLDKKLQEPYQMLRTNLVYSDQSATVPTYIFSSPTNTERRETVLGNLALAAADSGSRVLLLDADMRTPGIADALQLSNERGLVDLLALPDEDMENDDKLTALLEEIIQHNVKDRLDVLTSGTTSENPIRLLESIAMKRVLYLFQHSSYDFIVINTPPILLYPDASTLAALINVEVLLVLENARSRSENALSALDQVQQIGGRINGVVFAR
ncbi:MAG: hypothetical protein KC496_01145, partial [Anaerolineae bacterium]|nr:hypothetical protein [Anaerolineae bacterium]